MLSFLEKHPAIIPKESPISVLLIRHFHNQVGHQGRNFTLGALREAGFWITGSQQLIRSEINKCITCRLQRGKPQNQLMGRLPLERIEPGPPFTNVGMDCFGPFVVRDRRTESKRWAVIFTCLYSRAIHLEMVDDMTSDSFINSLRCFQAIRGPIQTLTSDAGTNFLGAKNEFVKALQVMQDSEMKRYIESCNIEFKTNPPASSHRGGAWERQIRTVRSVLSNMLGRYPARLDSSSLRTLLYEVMNTVNSRPLTADNLCSPQEVVISPNHILTMKTNQLAPLPGCIDGSEIYGRMRWRKVQQLATEFWTNWKNHYLKNITKRQRWETKNRNIKEGDMVAIVDDNRTRNEWKVGIIDTVQFSEDGIVRSARIRMANPHLSKKGTPVAPTRVLERSVQKIVLLLESEKL